MEANGAQETFFYLPSYHLSLKSLGQYTEIRTNYF